jgi:hypothetical protein
MAGFGDLEFMQRGRRFAIGIVMLGLGGLIGYALPKSGATPKAETGTIASIDNATQNAGIRFSITLKKVAKPESFRWQDATPWRDKAGHWHSKGTPTCLEPVATTPAMPVKVTVGVVDVAAANSASARTIVVWVKCYR